MNYPALCALRALWKKHNGTGPYWIQAGETSRLQSSPRIPGHRLHLRRIPPRLERVVSFASN